ncbi:MAG: sodium:solute symporter [Planctomycetota bacterium]
MCLLDWIITISLFIALGAMARFTKKYTRSVADFLAANRCSGRYIICIGEGMAALGALSVILQMEMTYSVGFAGQWWNCISMPIGLVMMLTGFVIYRYRQTRAMTLAQFFEIRYSRNFRIFAGILAFTAGVIVFGIFPATGANFFIRYCGLPHHMGPIPTFPVVVVILLAVSYYFIFVGGQVSVIVTDFLQGMFTNFVLLAILMVVLYKFRIADIFDSLLAAPKGQSMVNPFDLEKHEGFTVWFFVIFIILKLYVHRSWQGEQAYQCAATNAHEARMAGICSDFRWWAFWASLMLLPLCAYTLMNHPEYHKQATQIQQVLDKIDNEQVRHQMITPVAMTTFVPTGLLGAFAAAMFAAFISTSNTQMHSWGSTLVQDVLMPLYKKPLSARQHLKWLRLSIFGVAAFAFLFSCFFRQTQRLQLFLMITAQIFLAGAGSTVIGGLYWKRGTTAAAWSAMITGAILSISGLVLELLWKSAYDKSFPIDFKWMTAISSGGAILSYILVSLLGKRSVFNMDRMLHRGKYTLEQEYESGAGVEAKSEWSFKKLFGYTDDFTVGDKIICACLIFKNMLFFTVVIVVTLIALSHGLSDNGWAQCHYYMLLFSILVGLASAVWLTIGGFRDLKRLFERLRTAERNEFDDGRVIDHYNLDKNNSK